MTRIRINFKQIQHMLSEHVLYLPVWALQMYDRFLYSLMMLNFCFLPDSLSARRTKYLPADSLLTLS